MRSVGLTSFVPMTGDHWHDPIFAAAIALTRLMGSLLFEVSPIDSLTYVAVCLSLVAAAVLASYVPALRATMVNPVTALRAHRSSFRAA